VMSKRRQDSTDGENRVVISGGERLFFGFGSCGRRRGVQTNQVKFIPIQKLPLDFIAGFQTDGHGQGQRKADIEPGFLTLGSNGLDTQWISGLHIFSSQRWFCVVIS